MTPRYMDEERQRFRIRLLLLLALSAIGMLLIMLFRMQIRSGADYEGSLSSQSMRRVRLPARRGRILDRTGIVLADNRPAYELALYLEEFRQPGAWSNTIQAVMKTLEDLADVIQAPVLISEDQVRAHIHRRLPLPLVVWRHLEAVQMARFAERHHNFAGIDIQPTPLRTYPLSPLACHVIGYVGRADPKAKADAAVAFYLPEFEGKSGIEARYNRELRGEAGGSLIRVDAAGYRWEEVPERAAVPGADIQLTLDHKIQQWLETELQGVKGAAVVMDPSNGDVLAMASSPTYDHNRFVPMILATDWNSLRTDTRAPLLNRAVAGQYPPGSIFKPVVAMAALINTVIHADTAYTCTGAYLVGTLPIRCWHRNGHGPLQMRRALEQSCNPFFIDLAVRGGYEMVYRQAAALGLGQRCGIDLPFEAAGLLPDDGWKRRTQGDGWRLGDSANIAIGQGALLVTPLQMAVITAALANGGLVWQPRLAMGIRHPETGALQPLPPRLQRDLQWPPEILGTVQWGLHDVVQAPSGTGRNALTAGVKMAGKTGTAEVGSKQAGKRHGWMIAYAPFDRPRYAVAMIIEDAESGGITVAPRIGRLMARLFAGGET